MSDPKKTSRSPSYEGGIAGILGQMDARRAPMTFFEGESLPPLDMEFGPWKLAIIPNNKRAFTRPAQHNSANLRKISEIRRQLVGKSELSALHGLLIAHLRKRKQPAHTAALFLRMWAEEADHLLDQLDQRWLVSALTTFGEHGDSEAQRRVGQTMTVLFNTMKLYESERRYSGYDAEKPFPLTGMNKGPLPMEMDAFHLPAGGLDVNMLGRLWQDAGDDPVLRPLAHHLLDLLVHDPRTVFRRLRVMRKRRQRRDGETPKRKSIRREAKITAPVPHVSLQPGLLPSWGVVCTTNAPIENITRFVAHYLSLGAARVDLFFDGDAQDAEILFKTHPQIHVTTCNALYWQNAEKKPPVQHQLRQTFNATRAYHACELDFLAHFDVDEFLITKANVARRLRDVPADAAQARIQPAELLAPMDGPPMHFKITHRQAQMARTVLGEIYPNYGDYLSGGFVSHTAGKIFARTRIPQVRLGIHGLLLGDLVVGNESILRKPRLAHFHAADYDHFRARMEFRLKSGSYRKGKKDKAMQLSDILDFVMESEGEKGLRHFFNEVCTATPELRARLARHDMLVTHEFDLDAQVAKVFGPAANVA